MAVKAYLAKALVRRWRFLGVFPRRADAVAACRAFVWARRKYRGPIDAYVQVVIVGGAANQVGIAQWGDGVLVDSRSNAALRGTR